MTQIEWLPAKYGKYIFFSTFMFWMNHWCSGELWKEEEKSPIWDFDKDIQDKYIDKENNTNTKNDNHSDDERKATVMTIEIQLQIWLV